MPDLHILPALAPLAAYEALAAAAFARLQAGDAGLDDVRLAVARAHSFRDWDAVVAHARAVAEDGAVRRFEEAADAVVDGDVDRLRALLAADPELVRARSERICCFDPPVHRAPLLVYVAANGVENHRQRTPPSAVEVAEALLAAGAEPDATADLYGDRWSTLCLLVSSDHPAKAGLMSALVDVLVAHGASVDGDPSRLGTSPLRSALVFGQLGAADALLRHGARVADLPVAAGLGLVGDVSRLLPGATAAERHGALALAAQLGRAEVVSRLLDAGEDPDRFNPPGFHPHATPLHHAALHGHADVVELLLARGARADLRDPTWGSDPAGWARHAGHDALAVRLEGATRPPSGEP